MQPLEVGFDQQATVNLSMTRPRPNTPAGAFERRQSVSFRAAPAAGQRAGPAGGPALQWTDSRKLLEAAIAMEQIEAGPGVQGHGNCLPPTLDRLLLLMLRVPLPGIVSSTALPPSFLVAATLPIHPAARCACRHPRVRAASRRGLGLGRRAGCAGGGGGAAAAAPVEAEAGALCHGRRRQLPVPSGVVWAVRCAAAVVFVSLL
jgi:hypothetical protein